MLRLRGKKMSPTMRLQKVQPENRKTPSYADWQVLKEFDAGENMPQDVMRGVIQMASTGARHALGAQIYENLSTHRAGNLEDGSAPRSPEQQQRRKMTLLCPTCRRDHAA